MAYATVEQLRSLHGDKRLLNDSPSGASSPDARWELLLDGASAQIDRALRRQGYLLPIDFTGHEQEQAEFALICMNLALERGAPSLISTPEGVKNAADLARDELNEIAAGTRVLPFTIGKAIFDGIERPTPAPSDPWTVFDDRFWKAVNP